MLPNNKEGSLRGLATLNKKLERQELTHEYSAIIKEKKKAGVVEKAHLWWHGSEWLATPERWPADVLNEPSDERKAEAKLVSKVLKVAVNDKNKIKCCTNSS